MTMSSLFLFSYIVRLVRKCMVGLGWASTDTLGGAQSTILVLSRTARAAPPSDLLTFSFSCARARFVLPFLEPL